MLLRAVVGEEKKVLVEQLGETERRRGGGVGGIGVGEFGGILWNEASAFCVIPAIFSSRVSPGLRRKGEVISRYFAKKIIFKAGASLACSQDGWEIEAFLRRLEIISPCPH